MHFQIGLEGRVGLCRFNQADVIEIDDRIAQQKVGPQRADAVTDGVPREELLANAPEAAEGYFVVPKVVE